MESGPLSALGVSHPGGGGVVRSQFWVEFRVPSPREDPNYRSAQTRDGREDVHSQ